MKSRAWTVLFLLAGTVLCGCGEKEPPPVQKAESASRGKAVPQDIRLAPEDVASQPTVDDVAVALPGIVDVGAESHSADIEPVRQEDPMPSLFAEEVPGDALKTLLGSAEWKGLSTVRDAFEKKLPEYLSAGGSDRLSTMVAESFALQGEFEKAATEARWSDFLALAAGGLEGISEVSSVTADLLEFHNAAVERYKSLKNFEQMGKQLAMARLYVWLSAAALPSVRLYRQLFFLARSLQAAGEIPSGPVPSSEDDAQATLDKLVADLRSADTKTSNAALKGLEGLRAGDAAHVVPGLKEMLSSDIERDRRIAIRAALAIGSPARELVPVLVAGVSQPGKRALDFAMVVRAVSSIGGPDAMQALKGWARERKGKERVRAVWGLIDASDDMAGFLPELKQVLAENSDEKTGLFFHAIRKLDPASEDGLAIIRQALEAPEWRERNFALTALAGHGTKASALVPEVTLAIADALTRQNAVVALAALDPESELAFEALRYWLARPTVAVGTERHRVVLDALKGMGPRAAGAVPLVIEALKTPDATIRVSAIEALSGIAPGAPGSAAALAGMLEDPVIKVRLAAVQALGSLGPLAVDSLPVLATLATRDCAAVRAGVVSAAVRILGERADRMLTEAAGDPSPEVRDAVVQARAFLKEQPAPAPIGKTVIPALSAPEEPKWSALDTRPWKVEVTGDEPSLGPDDALVTIVVFGAALEHARESSGLYQTLATFVEQYPGEVRLVWKPVPGGLHGTETARAVWAAHEQGQFLPYLSAVNNDRYAMSDDKLKALAKGVGLDVGKWKSSVRHVKKERLVEREQELLRTIGERFPPQIYVNGQTYRGLVMRLKDEEIREMVDTELAKAKALEERGVPRADVYRTIIASGITRELTK